MNGERGKVKGERGKGRGECMAGKIPDGALPLFIGGTDARSKDRG